MPKQNLVVVFPIYNGAKTMEQSLKCIAEQDYRNFRAIIVENKSTDNTLAIARSFCAKDPRFEIVQNEARLGMIDNFMNSIRIARDIGDYFCLRACDDLSTPDYLSKLVAALDADPTKLLAVGSVLRIGPDQTRRLTPEPELFSFGEKAKAGTLPSGLHFPSEWFYGVYRSKGGAEILLERLPELGSAWCAASYTVAEFVVRDLVAYVEKPAYHFYEGSNSESIYAAKTRREKLGQLWRYTNGCFRVRRKLPPMSLTTQARLWVMFLKDARRKTRYRILGKF